MKRNRQTRASMYTRIIRWSREDGCYVGSLPEICGNCCHGDTVEEVCRQLDDIAEDWVGMEEQGVLSLAEPDSSMVITQSRFAVTKNAGAEIARLRHRLGLSQADFARALGVSLSTVSLWEQGRRTPSGSSAKLLAVIDRNPEVVLA